MKQIIIGLSMFLAAVTVASANGLPSLPSQAADNNAVAIDTLWNNAVAAYTDGDYEAALEGFTAIEEMGYASARLYYNIGNCYFKKDHFLGKSILYYERALKEDPSFEDAAYNLEIAREYTVDKIESVPEFILVTWIKAFRDTLSSNAWAWIFIVLLVLTAVLLLLFRFASSLGLRKASFSLAIVTFLFAAVAFAFSLNLRNLAVDGEEAVIMAPVSSVKSSPGSSDQSLFILHEGTKVGVVDQLGDWYRIELSDGRQGWTEKKNLEII